MAENEIKESDEKEETQEYEFVGHAFLKNTILTQHGGKIVHLEFSCADAIELAKLELLGRDLKSHLPVLLEVSICQATEDNIKKIDERRIKKPKQRKTIDRGSAVT